MKISKHVSYSEIIHSNTASKKGIANIPNDSQLDNIRRIAESVFEPVRRHFKVPIYISSAFRSAGLNKALKGAKNSQHMANNGAAFDLDADRYGRITNSQIFNYIKDNLEFDQLIWEAGDEKNPAWVHVSFNKGNNRNQVLVMYKENGKSKYKAY